MTKFDDFMKGSLKEVENLEELFGDYGCQTCEKQTSKAYFNDKELEIIWFCEDEHRSSIKLG